MKYSLYLLQVIGNILSNYFDVLIKIQNLAELKAICSVTLINHITYHFIYPATWYFN